MAATTTTPPATAMTTSIMDEPIGNTMTALLELRSQLEKHRRTVAIGEFLQNASPGYVRQMVDCKVTASDLLDDAHVSKQMESRGVIWCGEAMTLLCQGGLVSEPKAKAWMDTLIAKGEVQVVQQLETELSLLAQELWLRIRTWSYRGNSVYTLGQRDFDNMLKLGAEHVVEAGEGDEGDEVIPFEIKSAPVPLPITIDDTDVPDVRDMDVIIRRTRECLRLLKLDQSGILPIIEEMSKISSKLNEFCTTYSNVKRSEKWCTDPIRVADDDDNKKSELYLEIFNVHYVYMGLYLMVMTPTVLTTDQCLRLYKHSIQCFKEVRAKRAAEYEMRREHEEEMKSKQRKWDYMQRLKSSECTVAQLMMMEQKKLELAQAFREEQRAKKTKEIEKQHMKKIKAQMAEWAVMPYPPISRRSRRSC